MENYTFLETLGPTESDKQCLHFSEHPMANILDFQNGDSFFLQSGNISASKRHGHMIFCVYTYIFDGKESNAITSNVIQYIRDTMT